MNHAIMNDDIGCYWYGFNDIILRIMQNDYISLCSPYKYHSQNQTHKINIKNYK